MTTSVRKNYMVDAFHTRKKGRLYEMMTVKSKMNLRICLSQHSATSSLSIHRREIVLPYNKKTDQKIRQ